MAIAFLCVKGLEQSDESSKDSCREDFKVLCGFDSGGSDILGINAYVVP